MGAKSILGMMRGQGPWQLTPVDPGGAIIANISINSSSWLGDLIGGRTANDYEYNTAYPGSQNHADTNRTTDEYLEPSFGITPYTYDRYYWGSVNNFYPSVAGTLSKLCVRVTDVAGVGNERMVDTTLTVYKNDVATAMTITIPALTTGLVIGTETLTVVEGDYLYIKCESDAQDVNDPAYVGGDVEIAAVTLTFEAAGAGAYVPYRTPITASNMTWTITGPPWPLDYTELTPDFGWQVLGGTPGTVSFDSYPNASYSDYAFVSIVTVGGDNTYASTSNITSWSEAEARRINQFKVRAPGTYSNISSLIFETTTSTYNGYTSFRSVDLAFEVNGAVTIDAAVPVYDYAGPVEIVGSQAVADGDLINYSVVMGAIGDAGPTGLCRFQSDFVSNDEWFDIHTQGYTSTGLTYTQYTSDAPILTTETYWGILSGANQASVALDGINRETYEFPITERMEFKNLRVQVGYISGGTIRVGLMLDGLKQSQYVDISAAGWHEDATHTDYIGNCNGDISLAVYYVEVLTGTPAVRFDAFEVTARVVLADECGVTEGCPIRRDCPNSLTVSELTTRALRMVGEDPTSPVYWTTAEMTRNVNDAYSDFCRETKCLELVEAIQLSADSALGALSDRVGLVFRVTFDDRKLFNATKYELDKREAYWETESGYVEQYYQSQMENRRIGTYPMWDGSVYNALNTFFDGEYTYTAWATATAYVIGDRVTNDPDAPLMGYVCISAHTSGASSEPGVGASWETYWEPLALVVWAVKNPIPLVDNECYEEPEIPSWAHLALAYGAAARALRRHGEQRNTTMAAGYEALYEEYVTLMKAYVANRTPAIIQPVGSGMRATVRKPMPWDQEVS